MQPDAVPRQYAIIKASPRSLTKSSDDLHSLTIDLLTHLGAPMELVQRTSFRVTSAPTQHWSLDITRLPDEIASTLPESDDAVVPYEFSSLFMLEQFRKFVDQNLNRTVAEGAFTDIGADPGGSVADHYCPGLDGAGGFSTRREARRMLGLHRLPTPLQHDASGRPRVNVVIIDQGLHQGSVAPDNWGGGWAYMKGSPDEILPGTAKQRSHGAMIARNVLDVAPSAVIYDFPMIPRERIRNVTLFAHQAQVAYQWLRTHIGFLRQFEPWKGPWILVNAWGIYDRRSERPLGDYTENNSNLGHPLNKAVGLAVGDGMDVVFAAGNCGQFCPNTRCGPGDRGPGRSIWGANSHPLVITAGAVLTNEKWIGYSSQGPGQARLTREKPDISAPSHFRETDDPASVHTGTSTACALTAGAVGVLRSRWDTNAVSPADMKRLLAATARPPVGSKSSGRIGAGILDVGEAWDRLSRET
jgi:hypothetical protein